MKTCNVGFIGFGFMGKTHSYSYINLPLFYNLGLQPKITHVCTSREESARKGAELVGAENAVTDFRLVTENPDIDIVHICTPNHLHKDAVLSAMNSGKHIYCDKPLTATLDESKEIEQAMSGYKGFAQMALQNRFFPAVMRAKKLVEEGFVGEVIEFRAAYLHSGSADREAPLKWKLSKEAGGGVIADLGTHILDLVNYLVGDYDKIFADTHIAYADRPDAADTSRRVPVEAEDNVRILCRMKSGAHGIVEATKTATGTEDEIRFEIHGSNGAIRFNGMDAHHLEVYDRTSADKPLGGMRGWLKVDCGQRYEKPATGFPGPKFAIGWIRAHMASIANFIDCIENNRKPEPGLKQGIYLQELVEACRSSAITEEWTQF